MEIGMMIRNMGAVSTRATLLACARHAESEDSEGSGGRYLDPLATLAFLSAATERIKLGVGVLVLPFRPALPTAKWLATIQELSDGRLIFGAGVGWMEAEFRAVGVPRGRRGAITDDTLAFIRHCFAQDEPTSNGQPFLFLPRPARPPVLIGGSAPHALRRIVASGDGWMPGRIEPDALAPLAARLCAEMHSAGRQAPQIVVLTHLPVHDAGAARERVMAYEQAGASAIAHFTRYDDADEFARAAEVLSALQG